MQPPNLIDTKKFGDGASFGPMPSAGTTAESDVAIRCRVLTRLYAGGTSSAFAVKVGIGPTRWNNIEGSGDLSKDVAFKIVKVWPEISLDWLWRGLDSGLSLQRGEELHAAFKAVAAELRKPEKAVPGRVRRAS